MEDDYLEKPEDQLLETGSGLKEIPEEEEVVELKELEDQLHKLTVNFRKVAGKVATLNELEEQLLEREKEEDWKEEELEEKSTIMEAMIKARQAFENHFEHKNLDAAFFHLHLSVDVLDSNFTEVLEKINWEDHR